MTKKKRPAAPTHMFRAIWPVVHGNGAARTDEDLIRMATADLPNVATRHHATIAGPARGYVTEGRLIQGSGGHAHVVVIEAPAIANPPRPYHY